MDESGESPNEVLREGIRVEIKDLGVIIRNLQSTINDLAANHKDVDEEARQGHPVFRDQVERLRLAQARKKELHD